MGAATREWDADAPKEEYVDSFDILKVGTRLWVFILLIIRYLHHSLYFSLLYYKLSITHITKLLQIK